MEGTGAPSAYGLPLAGGGFDFYKFVRQPQTIVRLLSWVFAIVVFGSITGEGYINDQHSSEEHCMFNHSASACGYAVFIGVVAFLACLAFLVLDVYVPFMSNARERKYAVTVDLGFSGAWTFLWFVCFCLLASQWSQTKDDLQSIPADAARATIAFSFFSIATWGILTYFALGRFRHGVSDVATSTYAEPPADHNTAYPPTYAPTSYNPTTYTPTTYTYPSNVADPHQQPPFTSNLPPQGDAGYQPPKY